MPYELERLRPTLAAENDALILAALPGAAPEMQLAETRVAPIAVPRPQPFDTVTIGVVTGRPLKLEFAIDEVKTREVVRDDLILGFENGGKIVLKDFMHAFGLLGDQRTTVIQPDGKHYAFTELLAPTPGAKPEPPAGSPEAIVVEKPAPGETQRFKLVADKSTALNFGKSDVAHSEVNKEGELVVTFKDRAVLVLEGYSALKGSGDLALYYAKGDPFSPGDLAPGAGPDGAGAAEGGHYFTAFDPGASLGPLDHLGALGPEPVSLISPPGPPDSPPPTALPEPLTETPPELPPPVACAPELQASAAPLEDGGESALTWIVATGIEIGGDVESAGGRWGEGAAQAALTATLDAAQRGWIAGHDPAPSDAAPAPPFEAASLAAAPGAADGPGGAQDSAPMSSKDVFDSGDTAPAAAPAHADAGAGAFAAAIDFAAAASAAQADAPAQQAQNAAQHNVMGHG